MINCFKVKSYFTKFGGEWKSKSDVEKSLKKLKTEGEKKKAIECQIRYHKIILGTNNILPKEKSSLFIIKDNSVAQLTEHIIEIIQLSPHYEHLADLDEDEVHITGMTMLNRTEREELVQSRIQILQEKLEKQREKNHEKNNESLGDNLSKNVNKNFN